MRAPIRQALLPAFAAATLTAATLAAPGARADASACPTVRLDGPGKPLEHVPVMDQGKLGLCYSYAAAEMADAWRFSHGTQPPPGGYEQRLAPLAAAVALARFEGRKTAIDGGEISSVMERIRSGQGAACDKGAVLGAAGNSGYGEGQVVDEMSRYFQEFADYMADRPRLAELQARGIPPSPLVELYGNDTQAAARSLARQLHCALIENFVPRTAIPSEVVDNTNLVLARMIQDSSRVEMLSDYFAKACDGHAIDCSAMPPLKTTWFHRGHAAEARDLILAKLQAPDAQPVGITFCSGVLKVPRPFQGVVETPLSNGGTQYGCSDTPTTHAALVAGARPSPDNPGKCELLIRNTWGTDCPQYARAGWKCEGGQVWVDADELAGNVASVDGFAAQGQ